MIRYTVYHKLVTVRCEDSLLGIVNGTAHVLAVDQHIIDAVGHGLVHAHAAGGIGLGVKVTQKDPLSRQFQSGGQVDAGGGLAHAALLVYDCNDFSHE